MLNGPQPPGAGNIDVFTRPRTTKPAAADKAAFTPLDPAKGIPASPPPDALFALDRAAKVANDLRDRRLDVRFATPPQGPVYAKIVDDGGNVVREISIARALDLLSGDGPATIFDELA